jgi:DNA/RNA endonuclease YhcR with UshA esterase domain
MFLLGFDFGISSYNISKKGKSTMFNEKFNKPNPISQILLLLFLSQTLLSQKIYTSTEAINHIGEFASVKGKVHQVYISSRGNIFLNIVRIYPDNPFTEVIFKSDSDKFPNIKSFEGKTIIVTGQIKLYRNKPEIILNSPNQIKEINQ